MDVVTEEAAARLARRYPPARPNRWWIPVALALAAAGAAWLVWAGTYGATGITARVDAFDVRSDTVIAVTVTVDRPDPRSGADCLLFAQAVEAGIIASSNGSASVAPTPRRNLRRGRDFWVMKFMGA